MNRLPRQALPLLLAGSLSLPLPADPPAAAEPPQPPALRNPFQLAVPEAGHGLVPATGRQLPHGIRLLATAITEAGAAIAVLQLPGAEKDLVFVEKDDVIRIEDEASGTPPNAKAPGGTRKAAPLYLLVQNVSDKGVEVSPQQSPSEVHLIR